MYDFFALRVKTKIEFEYRFFLSFHSLMIAEKKVTIYGQQKVKSNGRLRIRKNRNTK